MIPKINDRGHSFKGVIAYLSHDKDKAETSERVAWHETGNMHTDDPEKAAKVMAWTDINREQIRAANGGSAAGRKASAGNIWHFSLAWALGENPGEEHQRETMHEFLEKHDLSAHEYILFGHNDTKHVHAHGVVNLVHPETGLIKDIGLDKKRSQQWALDYERKHGIHCEQRVENARKREQGEAIKYRDIKQDYADKITRAYYAADNGKAFIHALKDEGLELGKARRGDRSYVIVDERGDIQKLSRQLQIEEKGKLKTQAIQSLLSDIDHETVKDADQLSHEIKTRDTQKTMKQPQASSPDGNVFSEPWDRDQANRQWEESIVDAGIKADAQRRKDHEKQKEKQSDEQQSDFSDRRQQWAENLKKHAAQKQQYDKSHADSLDGLREFDSGQDRRRSELEDTLKQAYDRREQERLLSDAQDRAEKADTVLGRLMGQRKAALEEAKAYQKNVDNIAQREGEQRSALETKISAERELAGYEKDPSPAPEIKPPEPQFENAADMLAQYEKAAAPEPETIAAEPELKRSASEMIDQYEQAAEPPEPEIEPPEPEPQYEPPESPHDSASEALSQYEQTATPTNDNTAGQAPAQEQGQSHDAGGYER